jgi:hypothetical protein
VIRKKPGCGRPVLPSASSEALGQVPGGSGLDPLDRANDCLEVARDSLKKRNLTLASVALMSVDLALDSFMKMPSMEDHVGIAEEMRG